MATALQFRTEQAANDILRNAKVKARWEKLPISDLPADIAKLAHDASVAECMARRTMSAFKAAMDDKLVAPPGRKFIFAIERGVTDPNMIGDMLFAEVAGSTTSTNVTSFNALIAKYK